MEGVKILLDIDKVLIGQDQAIPFRVEQKPPGQGFA